MYQKTAPLAILTVACMTVKSLKRKTAISTKTKHVTLYISNEMYSIQDVNHGFLESGIFDALLPYVIGKGF